MSHITSSWAAQYCLEDPAPVADLLLAADGAAAEAAEATFDSVALASRFAAHPLGLAHRAVAASWSAEQPGLATQTLVAAHETVDDACTGAKAVAQQLAAEIGVAHAAVARAYAAADAAISAQDLSTYHETAAVSLPGAFAYWSSPWCLSPAPDRYARYVTAAERWRVDSGRQSVLCTLQQTLAAAKRDLDAAAVRAQQSLTPDPWATLPAALRPAAPHQAFDTDRANRQALLADLLGSGSRHELALSVLNALNDAAAKGRTAQLLVYDPDDPPTQGSVAISIGNLDSAADVAVVVPGILNSPMDIGTDLGIANDLDDAIQSEGGSTHGPTATVMWFGYDIPLSWPSDPGPKSLAQIGQDTREALTAFGADDAADRLSAFTATLRGIVPAAASLTLIGHSWGSIVVSEALSKMDRHAGVSRAVLLASPGVGYLVSNAKEYRAVDADDVYVVSLPSDPVANGAVSRAVSGLTDRADALRARGIDHDPGPYGHNPADPDFGATIIDVQSDRWPLNGLNVASHGITNYLGGDSLTAVAAVVAGNSADVPVRGRK